MAVPKISMRWEGTGGPKAVKKQLESKSIAEKAPKMRNKDGKMGTELRLLRNPPQGVGLRLSKSPECLVPMG